jgi:hypothetical protein
MNISLSKLKLIGADISTSTGMIDYLLLYLYWLTIVKLLSPNYQEFGQKLAICQLCGEWPAELWFAVMTTEMPVWNVPVENTSWNIAYENCSTQLKLGL